MLNLLVKFHLLKELKNWKMILNMLLKHIMNINHNYNVELMN